MSQQFNIGDRVQFLNAIGGGVVRKVLRSGGVVYVEDETGFEIPVMENELLKVEDTASVTGKETASATTTSPKPKVQPAVKRGSEPSGEKLNVSLCYLPEEGGKLGQSRYEVYLVNDSNYDLFITYTSGRGAAQELRYAGKIPFDTSELLESFAPDELPERQRTTIQLMAYKEEGIPYRPKQAMSFELKIDGARFFKENAFVKNAYFDDPAILFELVKEDQPLITDKLKAEQLAAEMMSQKIAHNRPKAQPKRGQAKKGEPMVVDLHIDELVDTTLGLAPKDMLEIQLHEVEKVMGSLHRPSCKGQKVIFIHGKGEGVLRKAVWNLLKYKYPHYDLQDASFQEYGFGATQVTIR